jgi:superfamily II DNA or RNA helicase
VFLANGFYKSRSQFLNRHAVFKPFSKFPQVMRWDDVSHLEMLRRKITVTMTPEKHTERHYEEVYTGYDREKYDRVIKDRWNPFTDEPVKDISEACRLMRQIVNSDGERLEALENLMKEHDKMIVFYNFNFELEALRTLEQLIVIAEWNGQRHQPIPKTDRWLYLVQYSAGAEGWNCVETDTVVFYSQSYSYKLMEQAAGRIDRMNTPFDDLYYYTFRSHASIDVAIARALKGKRTFNEKNFAKMTQLDLPLRTAP